MNTSTDITIILQH